jgi:hypothetical protein
VTTTAARLGRESSQEHGVTVEKSKVEIVDLSEDEEKEYPLTLAQYQIVSLWDDKLLSDVAFIVLALEFDRANDRSFDLVNFIHRWRGAGDPQKTLKRSTVVRVVELLEVKGYLTLDKIAVQLTLI